MQQSPPHNRLFFDRIFHRSYWTWRKHPAIIVPTMLASGLTAIEESAVTAPIIILLTTLAANHTLTQFIGELRGGTSVLGGFSALLNDPVLSIGFILVLASIAIAVPIVGIIGGGFVLSAEYGTYLQAWTRDSVSIGDVLENGRRAWKRTAWTLLLADIITWGPAALGIGLYLFHAPGIGTDFTLSNTALSLPYEAAAGILLCVSLIISIFTVYSVPITVIDNTSGRSAIGRSISFASKNFQVTLTYCIVRVIFQLLSYSLFFATFIGLPLSSLATIVLSLLLLPILHSTKTMIYSYGRPTETEMPFEIANPIWNDIGVRLPGAAWRKMRRGLSEMGRFLISPRDIPFHILATLALVLGIWLGDFVSANGLVAYLAIQPGTINPAVVNNFGPALGIDIFANNWVVSIRTGAAGLAFGIPSFETILFNGFIVGIIVPAFQNQTLLLAGLLPHGIIEIPSLVISGSVGLKLGWAALRSKIDPTPENKGFLSLTLRQTIYVLVGLAPLFLIAGTIEGNITPIIMRYFGWTG